MSKLFRDSGLPLKAAGRFNDVDCSDAPSLTVQADADAADINKIVARIQKGGAITTSSGEPFYGDVSEFGDLQDSLIKVRESNELFMKFDADLRSMFDNDPVKFVDFMADPANTDKAIELGLAIARPKPVVPEPPADLKPV